MFRMRFFICRAAAVLLSLPAIFSCERSFDVAIVGAGAGGCAAALQAARSGASVLLLEEGPWVGGMLTSAGVSAIDGNYRLRGGIFGEFCDSLAARYGGYEALRTGWVSNILFEPQVGEAVLGNMLAAEENICLHRNISLDSLTRKDAVWHLRCGGRRFRAAMLVDCTELGDVAARLGIPYDLGMDSSRDMGEDVAPEEANDIIQDLTYVITARFYDRDMTISRPEGYDASLYEGCNPGGTDAMLSYGLLPGGDVMLNWPINGNDAYMNLVEAGKEERDSLLEEAKRISLGYLYYIQTELGHPELGIAEGVYPSADGLPLIPYHRESRRIHGRTRFTVNDVFDPYRNNLYRTSVAVGDYSVDHHHRRYPCPDSLPDLHFYPVPSFSVPAGVIVPRDERMQENETCCPLLVAEKSVSVSNIVNGTTRLQPVVMGLGQAAGAMAALSAAAGREATVRELQDELLEASCYLMPYQELTPYDEGFASVQRVGLTGILRGRGESIGWQNRTLFRPDDPLLLRDLYLEEYYGREYVDSDRVVTLFELCRLLGVESPEALDRPLTRIDAAILIDTLADPFHSRNIDWTGKLL